MALANWGATVTRPSLRIVPGDWLVLGEEDYKFGTGELTVRVASLAASGHPGWVSLDGFEIAWNGTDRMPRSILVRIAALAEALEKGGIKRRQIRLGSR